MKFTYKLYIKEKDAPEAKAKLHSSGKIEAPSIVDAKKGVEDKVRVPYGFEVDRVKVVLIKNNKD